MTEVSIVADRRVRAGTSPGYVSPYGQIAGLAQRLAAFRERLCTDRSVPWQGTGLIADLEVVVRLLNVREFVDDLSLNGNGEQARWAAELLDIIDTADEHEQLLGDIEAVVPVGTGQEYAEAVEIAARKAVQADAVRAVLVNVGALAPGDTDTDLPSLVRALLS